jgi:hypothetical protein
MIGSKTETVALQTAMPRLVSRTLFQSVLDAQVLATPFLHAPQPRKGTGVGETLNALAAGRVSGGRLLQQRIFHSVAEPKIDEMLSRATTLDTSAR